MAVKLALDPILEHAGRLGQKANDFELTLTAVVFCPIRRKTNDLADSKLMRCHVQSSCLRWAARCVVRAGQALNLCNVAASTRSARRSYRAATSKSCSLIAGVVASLANCRTRAT
jgi:hypothetical protein